MRISNETKIGLLTAVGIAVLIFGFNFLKGNAVFENETRFYAVFPSIDGLSSSNPVLINGLQVGTVSSLKEKDKTMSGIIVEMKMSKDILVPDNSIATINPSLGGLGTTTINISLGESGNYLQDGDTMQIQHTASAVEELKKNVAPTLERINGVMDSLKTTLGGINQTLDPNAQENIKSTIAHLAQSTASLQQLLNTQHGALANSLANVETFTGSLVKNEESIQHVIDNMDKATTKLSNIELEKTMASLEHSASSLDNAISKLNETEGSAGLLLNDDQLYRQLENSARSLNILLDDLRVNPKRYVSFSIFGKKNKNGPLVQPAPVVKDTIKVTGDTVIVK